LKFYEEYKVNRDTVYCGAIVLKEVVPLNLRMLSARSYIGVILTF